jgi:carboxypeptidase C (cathepsin A)
MNPPSAGSHDLILLAGRRRGWSRLIGPALLLAALAPPLSAQDGPAQQYGQDLPVPKRQLAITHHEIRTVDNRLRYVATAGYLPLGDGDRSHHADVFFVAYTAVARSTRQRPITFLFNGGPGQPAVWLHLGIGPKRVVMEQPSTGARFAAEGSDPPPYRRLEPNPHTWLAETDLVFVDPISTGYSRAARDHSSAQFHGYSEDVEYLGEFIRLFLTRFERWGSPKFLVGESYGTTRVSGLANHLQERHGIYLNGVLLVSAVLNWQTARFHIGNDLPFLLALPSYTATAWYHGLLRHESLDAALEESTRFALGDYALALLRGDEIERTEHAGVAARLAELTGLSAEFIERSNLRISSDRFTKELRRNERITIGRLDSRYIGVDRDAAGERYDYDPSYYVYGPYSTLINEYIRYELEYRNDLPYEVRAGDLVRPWSYASVENRYLNVAEELRAAMHQNPYLHVFVASGYYDLATPFFAVDYTISHMQLAPVLRQNVHVKYYEAGHMMYIHPPSLIQLRTDITEFYHAASPGRPGLATSR